MYKRYLYLAAGTLILLFVGLIYAWSVFVLPLEKLHGWDRAQTTHIFTFSMSVFCVGGILGGYLIRKKSAAFIIRCSAVLMCAGFWVCANTSSLLLMYLAYGVVCSLGVGLVYNAVLSTVVKWFPDKSALCSGILLMGFGAGGFLLGQVANLVIVSFGVNNAFLCFAVICIVVLTLASFLIFSPKENESAAGKKAAQPKGDIATKDMIRTKTFWFAFLWGIFSSAAALAVIGQAASMAQSALFMTSAAAAFVVGLMNVSNGVGRVFMGLLYPRLPKKMLMICISGLFSVAALFLAAAVSLGLSGLVYPGLLILGYAYGSVPAFGVAFVRESFGTKFYSVNMSVFNMHLIFSALIGSSVVGQIFSMTGEYPHVLLLTFGLGIIAVFFAGKMKTGSTK
ncbi:MAG: MFS transporter [Clostridiales bacterium]|nr:MFS transporter [Clostridiales bacterium]